MRQLRIFSRGLRVWIRDLHCYFGLFISPFILIFALTAIMFNHKMMRGNAATDIKIEKETASVIVPTDLEGLAQARQVMRQLDISGEVVFAQYQPKQNRLIIAVVRPGLRTNINVNLQEQRAEIERRHVGFWRSLFYLHRSPGPHNIKYRANWFFTKIWAFLADATVYLFVFISISGVYMWYVAKSERKIGLILLAAGCLSFFLIVLAIVH